MTTPPPEDKRPEDEDEAKTELASQQQQLFQQQLQQQQLQLLQLQTQLQSQQLQNLSPSELSAVSQQLALLMMPMMPFVMPLQQQSLPSAGVSGSTDADTLTEAAADNAGSATESDTSPPFQPASAEASGLTPPPGAADGFGLLGASFGNLGATGSEETPKRKRGRPPKKDAARIKAENEKNLKQQFPMWGYGLPMPLLSGLPGFLPPLGNPGAVVKDHSTEEQVKDEENQDGERPAKMAKKKTRGTGKPRGRPRTRPRPGEVIRRAKLLPIAPANYSVMYNYSLSNLAQKSAELNADGDATADANAAVANSTETETVNTEDANDENRLAPLATSLLNEHE